MVVAVGVGIAMVTRYLDRVLNRIMDVETGNNDVSMECARKTVWHGGSLAAVLMPTARMGMDV